jgi:hypothetical protein
MVHGSASRIRAEQSGAEKVQSNGTAAFQLDKSRAEKVLPPHPPLVRFKSRFRFRSASASVSLSLQRRERDMAATGLLQLPLLAAPRLGPARSVPRQQPDPRTPDCKCKMARDLADVATHVERTLFFL